MNYMVFQKERLPALACRASPKTWDLMLQSAATATHVWRSASHEGADGVESDIWTLRTSGYSRKSDRCVDLVKILGTEYPADILTKDVAADLLNKMLQHIGMVCSENVLQQPQNYRKTNDTRHH